MLSCEAKFFGEESDPTLFGIVQPCTQAAARDEVILICYPAPQEIMRTYWAHRQLSQELAKLGYATLRFDYYGTGDSLGQTAQIDLERWKADIRAAFRHLKRSSRSPKVSVLGTRLGASLACQALADTQVHRFILWDPIVLGSQYLEQLQDSHGAMLSSLFNRRVKRSAIAASEELLGFAAPAGYQAQLQAMSWKWPEKTKGLHVVSSEAAQSKALEAQLGILPSHYPVHFYGSSDLMLWQDPMALKMQAFPQQTLQLIARIMEGGGS